jgi:hypothetical protein
VPPEQRAIVATIAATMITGRRYRSALRLEDDFITHVDVVIAGGAVQAHDYRRDVKLKGPLFRVQDGGTGAPLQFRSPMVATVHGHDFGSGFSFHARVVGARVDLWDHEIAAYVTFLVN